jgi:hypothetical protein
VAIDGRISLPLSAKLKLGCIEEPLTGIPEIVAQLPIGRPAEQRLVHPAANGNACDLVVAASVRCQPYDCVMSALGRKRTSRYFYAMSGLPPKADTNALTAAQVYEARAPALFSPVMMYGPITRASEN